MWTMIAVLVLSQSGEPVSVEVTRNIRDEQACRNEMTNRKLVTPPAGQEVYLFCIPKPEHRGITRGHIKL